MGGGLSKRERREKLIEMILIAALIPLAAIALYGLYVWSITFSGF
jgi:hypothetical protein